MSYYLSNQYASIYGMVIKKSSISAAYEEDNRVKIICDGQIIIIHDAIGLDESLLHRLGLMSFESEGVKA